jgi:hypothetical protein
MPPLFSKSRITFVAVALMSLLNFGCSIDIMEPINERPFDEKVISFENTPGPMDVALAKRYYERLIVEKGEFLKPQKTGNADPNHEANLKNLNNKRYPSFDQAYVSETAHSTAVEIPIRFDIHNQHFFFGRDKASLSQEDIKMMATHSFDRFFIYKNKKTGEIRHWMLTYIPAINYLKKSNFNVKHNQLEMLDKKFSGQVLYKQWDGSIIYMLTFADGKRTGFANLKRLFSSQTGE